MFLMAGAILLIFLTLLGGVTNTNPLNQIYFLQACTANIPGAPAVSRWTLWSVCSVGGTNDTKGKSICGTSHSSFPFDPPNHRNFGTTINVPPGFIGTRHYFLTSRFLLPFMIITLFFAVCSFFVGCLSMCSKVGSYLSAILAWVALVFQILSTTMMTYVLIYTFYYLRASILTNNSAVFVQGRNAFSSNGQSSKLGVNAFAFMWTALACIIISSVLYCVGGAAGGRSNGGGYTSKESAYSGASQQEDGYGRGYSFASRERPQSRASSKRAYN